jgi:hypothetical protein
MKKKKAKPLKLTDDMKKALEIMMAADRVAQKQPSKSVIRRLAVQKEAK